MSSQQPPLRPVPHGQRYRYGCGTMQILATNQPTDVCLFDYAAVYGQTFSVPKRVYTVQNRDFELLFAAQIQPRIVELLHRPSIPKECKWTLNVFRMGFEVEGLQTENSIVVHLCVANGYLSDQEACTIGDDISAAISAAQWLGEKIHVDICEAGKVAVELRATDSEVGADLSECFSELYNYNPPCPGFSVGPEDNGRCAGSLTGFVKHGDDLYGLTCEHVLNSSIKLLGSGSYTYKKGGKEFIVTMPAVGDHSVTKAEISAKRQRASMQLTVNEQRLADNLISSMHHDCIQRDALPLEKRWEKAEQNANQFKIRVGHVRATSGSDKSKQFHHGVLDWGIFDTSFREIHNKHPEYTAYDKGSGFQLFNQEEKSFVEDKLGGAFFESAFHHFMFGPEFKGLQEESPIPDQVYFKPASRSLGWRACVCNGVMTTAKDNEGMMTDEYCFIGRGLGEAISEKGDSGAVLVDSDFRPVAMLWGGGNWLDGFKDVTFGTPLTVILRDIERRMGWENGSVTYC